MDLQSEGTKASPLLGRYAVAHLALRSRWVHSPLPSCLHLPAKQETPLFAMHFDFPQQALGASPLAT